MSDRARANYEGYRARSDGKSLVSGEPIPPFDDLDPAIQDAWDAGADAVEQRFALQFQQLTGYAWNAARPLVTAFAHAFAQALPRTPPAAGEG